MEIYSRKNGTHTKYTTPPVGHVLARCATGTTQLLPAPPPGYLHRLGTGLFKNTHASSSLTFRLSDANGDMFGPGAAGLAAGNNSQFLNNVKGIGVDSAVSVTVSGAGSPLDVQLVWHREPKPEGWACGVVALTTSYQTIPNVVPAQGYARPWGSPLEDLSNGNGSDGFIWNGDTGAVVINFRLIRDGVTFDWASGPGAGSSNPALTNVQVNPGDILKAGDVYQVKVAAINTPGAAIVRYYYQKFESA